MAQINFSLASVIGSLAPSDILFADLFPVLSKGMAMRICQVGSMSMARRYVLTFCSTPECDLPKKQENSVPSALHCSIENCFMGCPESLLARIATVVVTSRFNFLCGFSHFPRSHCTILSSDQTQSKALTFQTAIVPMPEFHSKWWFNFVFTLLLRQMLYRKEQSQWRVKVFSAKNKTNGTDNAIASWHRLLTNVIAGTSKTYQDPPGDQEEATKSGRKIEGQMKNPQELRLK
jgi:hypothetical protein